MPLLAGINVFALGTSYIFKTSLGLISLVDTLLIIAMYMYYRENMHVEKVSRNFICLVIGVYAGIFGLIHHVIYKVFVSGAESVKRTGGENLIKGFVGLSFVVSFIVISGIIVLTIIYVRDCERREKVMKLRDLSFKGITKGSDSEDEVSGEEPDIVLGVNASTGKKVIWQHMARYLHLLCLGPTGCGKTSQILLPTIYQDIQKDNIGLTVLDPKGDLAETVWALAKMHNKPIKYFDPIHPNCPGFNPLFGPEEDIIENTCTTFKMLAPDSSQFFQDQNENLLRNALKVIKRLEASKPDLYHANLILLNKLIQNVNDEGKKMVIEFSRLSGREEIRKENEDISAWFINDYFTGASGGRGGTKTYEHCSGVRAQISKLISNKYLRKILNKPPGEDSIDFEKHLAEGGIVAMSSCQGHLRDLAKTLGLFLILQFQAAVFRRPGDENSRMPHMLMIDEFQEFANNSMGILLTQGRSYRVGCHLATQARRQIEIGKDGKSFLSLVSANARNLVVFPGIEAEDAEYYSRQFGDISEVKKREVETVKPFDPFKGNFGYQRDVVHRYEEVTKTRYTASDIRFRQFKEMTYGLIRENSMQEPGLAYVEYIPMEVKVETDRLVQEYREERDRLIEEMEQVENDLTEDSKKCVEDNEKTMYYDKVQGMSKFVEDDIDDLDALFNDDQENIDEDIDVVIDDDIISDEDDFLGL